MTDDNDLDDILSIMHNTHHIQINVLINVFALMNNTSFAFCFDFKPLATHCCEFQLNWAIELAYRISLVLLRCLLVLVLKKRNANKKPECHLYSVCSPLKEIINNKEIIKEC
jgi:hypothetical protein